ncbi:MAG: OmpA family protein [Bacteroidia bacterium]
MMKKLFILLIVIIAQCAAAQNVEFVKKNFEGDKAGLKEALKSIDAGDVLYQQGIYMYNLALPSYLQANNFNPNNALLNFKIGSCYLYSAYKSKSLTYLQKAFSLNPNVDPQIHLLLGEGYHLNMDWDKAIGEFQLYLQNTPAKKENMDNIAAANKGIEECNTGKEMVQHPVRVFIDNLGDAINTKYPEYGPLISADESEMIFTSRRPNTTGGQIDPGSGQYFEDLYISYFKDGKWTPAEDMGPPIDTPDHDATAGLSADGQTLYVYRFKEKDGGDIYESDLQGDQWSKPERMSKKINSPYHESTVSLSPDGNTLYFVSDKPGGLGGRDIYMTQKDDKGKWGDAQNLGPVINTKYDEEGCFIHPDGKTLYFSSKGHNTMGGYDIFKSVYENGQWSEPVNLGYPINSADDDVFFVISGSGKHGYYASAKGDSYGDKDIYMITFLGPEKPLVLNNEDNLLANAVAPVKEMVIAPAMEIKTARTTILKGVITDAITQQPLEASIEIVDIKKNQTIATFSSNSKSGKYLVSLPSGKNYGITVKAPDYLFHSENVNLPDTAAYQVIEKNIALNKVAVGSKIVLENIFFDTDKATLRPESTNELERLIKLMNDVPTLKIEISGHTDNKGSLEHNQKLSESRAQSVVNYLVSKGISASRLQFKGYGMTQPIATNDTDEGRQQNRRTEFKILSK